MLLKTILNRIERFKSFVYVKANWVKGAEHLTLEIHIRERSNSRPVCSGCGKRRPGYDRLPERRFEYPPIWQIAVFFVYGLRRVSCPECGVKAEKVPWSDGKESLTKTYRWFLAGWAQRLSWKEVAGAFHSTWDHVRDAVDYAVRWGLVHREERGVEAIGVDEIQWQRGHKYLTLVYQIDATCKRLLWIVQDRKGQSLREFFDLFGDKVLPTLRFVCSDMWQPYLDVIVEQAAGVIHILDRFHVMAKMNKALDEIRAGEARRLKADGYEPVLKHSRWCILKRPENRTAKQTVTLKELLKYNLQTVRGYLQREDFQRFWEYRSPTRAGKFLNEWCTRVMRSKIEPMKEVARTLRNHRELLLNWFEAEGTISSGVVEGMNNKVKLTTRKSYGFRTFDAVQLALLHNLGALPVPKFTHKFY